MATTETFTVPAEFDNIAAAADAYRKSVGLLRGRFTDEYVREVAYMAACAAMREAEEVPALIARARDVRADTPPSGGDIDASFVREAALQMEGALHRGDLSMALHWAKQITKPSITLPSVIEP